MAKATKKVANQNAETEESLLSVVIPGIMLWRTTMTHEIISKGQIRLDVSFDELLSLRNLAKATRYDDLCNSLDAVISDIAERCKE